MMLLEVSNKTILRRTLAGSKEAKDLDPELPTKSDWLEKELVGNLRG